MSTCRLPYSLAFQCPVLDDPKRDIICFSFKSFILSNTFLREIPITSAISCVETHVARNWNEFQQHLRKQGIEMEFKYKSQTPEVQGIRFIKYGLSYKGSQIDRAFSFSKLDAQLSQANHQEQPKEAFTP